MVKSGMKTILIALNAHYTHSSLALRYLREYNKHHNIEIAEFTINDSINTVYSALLSKKADFYCFSCYIWNVELTLKIASMLKIAMPQCRIVFGGPECSYSAEELIAEHIFIDHIITGEGEKAFDSLLSGENHDRIIKGQDVNLADITLPYSDNDLQLLRSKIIYFETSRGCPFRCSYCLSAAKTEVRYFPVEYVERGFDLFFRNDVSLVKLIDRTFNSDAKRAAEIIRYIKANSTVTSVHLEVEPSILTGEIIDELNTAPIGMFQLEIGIQTINEKTLAAINRKNNIKKITENISKLKNTHLHIGLIAGLPYEDYESFSRSFNYVYSLNPDMLQLGFLKLLHGAPIEKQSGIKHRDFPPYEVIATDWLSADDLCRLKKIENTVDCLKNSGIFARTLEAIVKDDPFAVFEFLSDKIIGVRRADLYDLLYDLYGEKIKHLLLYDFLLNNKDCKMPSFIVKDNINDFKNKCYKFCRKHKEKPDLKMIRFEAAFGMVLMVDYTTKMICDVTAEFD